MHSTSAWWFGNQVGDRQAQARPAGAASSSSGSGGRSVRKRSVHNLEGWQIVLGAVQIAVCVVCSGVQERVQRRPTRGRSSRGLALVIRIFSRVGILSRVGKNSLLFRGWVGKSFVEGG